MSQIDREAESLYKFLSGEDDQDRACDAIPASACTDVPQNYILNVSNGAATKLAQQLAGPNLVLPWLMTALGAPAAFVGLLMPVKQTGSLLPQLVVSGQIRKAQHRKWYWVVAGLTQSLILLLIIAVSLTLPVTIAGITIAILFALFSVASGVGSVAFQDVMGKTIPKGRRGHLLANRATIGGALTILAGLIIRFWIGESAGLETYLGIVLVAMVLWVLGAIAFANISESPGATEGGKNAIQEALSGIQLFRTRPAFQKYLLSRTALLSIEVAAPFYVIYAQSILPSPSGSLGTLVIAVGFSKIISSPFWGQFADQTSRKTMILSGFAGALTGTAALAFGVLPINWRTPYLFAIIFVLLGLSEAGVRLGRKTFLVDAFPGDDFPTFVAFGNTSIGLVTLLYGALGLLIQIVGIHLLIGVLVGLGLAGTAASYRMPEAEEVANLS